MATLDQMDETPIQNFYKDVTIFITGGTGFLGRILIEKLLRVCPDIRMVYLLVRNKKNKGIELRLDELFGDEIFNCLRKARPDFRKKVRAVTGDCSEMDLGLSETDKEILYNEINIVFHVAATVNFDEKLQKATFINIRGTRDVLKMCKQMKKLKFVTHVSTAYAHCTYKKLEERFYEEKYSSEAVIALAENLQEDDMESIKDTLMGKFPNSYVFTKSISEDLIEKNSDLPIALYRPAIIVSTYKEPVAGWINNFYGPQGVSTAAMLGLLRSLHCDEDLNANIVPVDMCVNALIAIPWQARRKYDEAQEQKENVEKYKPPIYYYESDTNQPINWKLFKKLTKHYGIEYISAKMLGIYFFHLRKNKLMHNIAIIFMHYLPALLLDGICTITGKEPMLWKAYNKIHRFTDVISYFSTKKWQFSSLNMRNLWTDMSERDKDLFQCDLGRLDWNEFFQTYLKGCRVYLLKENLDTIAYAKKRYVRLQIYTVVGISVFVLLVLGLLWLLWRLIC